MKPYKPHKDPEIEWRMQDLSVLWFIGKKERGFIPKVGATFSQSPMLMFASEQDYMECLHYYGYLKLLGCDWGCPHYVYTKKGVDRVVMRNL